MAASFKLRLTTKEDALLRSFAQLHAVRVSTIVRDAVCDALRARRKASPRDPEGPRETAHNVRLVLTQNQRATFRSLSHGVDFNTWAWLVVMEDLENGRAAARYRSAPTSAPVEAAVSSGA